MRDSTGWLGMTISGATGLLLLVAGAIGCGGGDDDSGPPRIDDSDPVFDGVGDHLVDLSDACVVAGSTVTLTLPATGGIAVVQLGGAGEVLINTIADCGGSPVTASSVTQFRIVGHATVDDTVVLDYAAGLFMDGRAGADAVIDLVLGDGGNDSLRIRGTSGADSFALGLVGAVTSVMTSADANADINATGVETVIVSAGDGDDSVTAAGNRASGSPIELPIDYAITVYGGAGADTLAGGTAADIFNGGDGVDTVDYSTKLARVTASLDGLSNDGVQGETDKIAIDIENLTGSATMGNTLTGDLADNVLTGGGAADVLDGGDGDDRLAGGAGADSMESGEGDDVIEADDGAVDTLVDAGDGNDICIVDVQDVNVVDCELQ